MCSSFNNALLPLYAIALFDATPEMIGSIMFIHGLALAVFNIPGGHDERPHGPQASRAGRIAGGERRRALVFGRKRLLGAVRGGRARRRSAAFSSPAVAALTADVCDPRRRGEAFGYFLTSFNLGMVLGSLVFGFVAEVLDCGARCSPGA
jgi:MFS family permease